MIDYRKLEEKSEEYKKCFAERFKDEMFKWQAIAWFQKHWDINADDFEAMVRESTKKAGSLLGAANFYPVGMIRVFAKADKEATRKMFINLFDESQDLAERLLNFQNEAERLRIVCGSEEHHNHYQNFNAITTYLWLRYPEKYFIYKYQECKKAAIALDSDFIPKTGSNNTESVIGGLKLYSEIAEFLRSKPEFRKMLDDALPEDAYRDPKLNTLAIDFAFFISRGGEAGVTEPRTPDSEVKSGSREYWWLVSNPKIWAVSGLAVNGAVEYTVVGKSGRPRRIASNFENAKKGDVVFCYESTPTKQLVALAEVDEPSNGKTIKFRKIRQLENPLDYSELSHNERLKHMQYFSNPLGSLFAVTQDEADELLETIDAANPNDEEKSIAKYNKKEFLKDVFMDEEEYDELRGLLEHKKNIILQGAPGVGKTFAAKRLAYSMMGEADDNRIGFVQFHQNYSYEDFMLGYKPSGEAGDFELVKGVFYKFCIKAGNHPDQDYFFIIDEINRGNLSKIFGELLMAIESGYRGKPVTLAYGERIFTVPENIYIIGMMNTADRSLAMMDYALRRRFGFHDMRPAFDKKSFKKYEKEVGSKLLSDTIEKVKELNAVIIKDDSLGEGFCIGHSYFCKNPNEKKITNAEIRNAIKHDILPTLKEYWFDNKSEYEKWEGEFNKLIK